MDGNTLAKQLAYGALAGVAGTLAIQVARSANQRLLPNTMPPMQGDPGQRVLQLVEDLLPASLREKLPKSLESIGSSFLSFGYGSTGAAMYTALRSDPNLVTDGAALGAALWAAGYMGWLPAMGLTPTVNKQKSSHIASSLLQHVLYGVATVAAYRKLRSSLASS